MAVTWTATDVRIGRRQGLDLTVVGTEPDAIALALWKLIRDSRLLLSRDFMVDVEMAEDGASCSVVVAAGGRQVGEFTMDVQ